MNFGRLLASSAVLASSSVIVNVMMLSATPFIARFYGPTAFGVFSVYMSYFTIISVISSLRYEIAIPTPKLGYVATDLGYLSSTILLITTVVVLFFISMIDYFNDSHLDKIYYMMPLTLLFAGFYSIYNNIALRNKKIHLISITRVVSAAILIISQLTLSSFAQLGLVISSIFSNFVAFIFLLLWGNSNNPKRPYNFTKIRRVAKRYLRYPIYTGPAGFVNSFSAQLPTIYIAASLGVKEAGIYAIAHKLISAPISISQSSFGKIVHGYASERNSIAYKSAILKLFLSLNIVGLLSSIILISYAPQIINVFLGEAWGEATVIISILSLSLGIHLSTSPITMLLNIYGYSNYSLYANVILALCKISGLYFGSLSGSFEDMIFIFVLFNFVGYFVFLNIILFTIGHRALQMSVVAITSFVINLGFYYIIT